MGMDSVPVGLWWGAPYGYGGKKGGKRRGQGEWGTHLQKNQPNPTPEPSQNTRALSPVITPSRASFKRHRCKLAGETATESAADNPYPREAKPLLTAWHTEKPTGDLDD